MIQILSNPIFWQGFGSGLVLALLAAVGFLVLIGQANDDIPLDPKRRAGDRRGWPTRSANDDTRSPRSEMRGGPR